MAVTTLAAMVAESMHGGDWRIGAPAQARFTELEVPDLERALPSGPTASVMTLNISWFAAADDRPLIWTRKSTVASGATPFVSDSISVSPGRDRNSRAMSAYSTSMA